MKPPLFDRPLADEERAAQIAKRCDYASQSVCNAIRAFATLDDFASERLRTLLNRSPRDFGKPTSL